MLNVKIVKRAYHDTQKGIKVGYLKGLEESLVILEGQAKSNAPVDKGFLRNSIGHKIKNAVGRVFTNIKYAWYQEDGTKYMAAANGGKGYMKPAAAYLKTRLAAIFGAAIRKEIRKS